MLELVVVLSGAGLMVLELAGARVLTPYFGSSLFVWTGLIGVILTALSLGYFLGGRIADKNPEPGRLAMILFSSGVYVLAMVFLSNIILSFLAAIPLDLRSQTLLASIILFGPSSILFGIVSPYAVRLKINDVAHSGALVGNLYALSTLGSIAGTFFGGFYIIPWLGTSLTLKLVAGLMIALGALYAGSLKMRAGFALVLLVTLIPATLLKHFNPASAQETYETDTAYNHVQIFERQNLVTGRPQRILSTGKNLYQSVMYLDNPDELVSAYTKFFRIADYFKKDISHGLMVGGGAYSYPRDFLRTHPRATLDVVEIDPGLTKIAEEYFHLTPNPRLTIYHKDARVFLNTHDASYDTIFIDAFQSFTPPFQLVTKEAIQKQYDLLTDDGVLVINIIGSLEGPFAEYINTQIRTYQSVFKTVLLFPVQSPLAREFIQNIVLVALKSPTPPPLRSENSEFQTYLLNASIPETTKGLVLTDDHAPIELYAIRLAQGLHDLLSR